LRPLWVSCIILVGLFFVLQWNVQYLEAFVNPLHDKLLEAEACVEEDDWETAMQLTKEVHETWKGKQFYLHVTLRHSDIDQVTVLLEQAMAYIEHKKIGEYAAVNKAIIGQMELLIEMESLTLRNVL